MGSIDFAVYAVLIYVAVVSLFASVLTILDKYFAINHKRRIPEAVLMIFGLLGGALAEYSVMKMIHHKTLHKKFMIGLPVMIALHITIIVIIELIIHGTI